MAVISVPTTNPLITSPFVDADESSYGEVPVEKQFELRVGNATPGAGALIEARNSTSQIVEAERVGETLDLLTSATGWTGDAAVTPATVASAPASYSGNSLQIQGTGASSTDRGARLAFVKNLSVYGGATLISLHRRISSVTNLTRAVIRFEFATASDWAQFELANSGTALNTWAEITAAKGAPQSTNGTVAWGSVSAIRLFLDVSGAYTGNLDVRDLRIGTTRTNKTAPDGFLAYESTYDLRVRYRDAATPTTVFGPWSSWITIKASQPPVVTATAPGAGASVTDPTPAYTWTYSSAGAKAQAKAVVDLYEVVAGQDELVNSYVLTGAGTSLTQPAFILRTGKTYAWVVTATDTDGLTGSSARRTFTTSFAQPSAPTGLTVTTDEDSSSALLTWTGPIGTLEEWRVYRRKSGGALERISTNGETWEEGDPAIVLPTLTDYHVPEGIAVEYLVSAHSGSASGEGESSTISETGVILTDRWMNVIPGIPDRTFEVRYVRPGSFTETPELQMDEQEPIGRPTIHVTLGVQLEAKIRFELFVTREDRDIIAKLRSIASDETLAYAILKSPEGDVWRVQYGTIPKTYGEAGTRTVNVPATVVAQ